LAAELGVELASVAGTGPGGRVTTDDVRAAAETAAYGAAAIPPDARAGGDAGAGPVDPAPDAAGRQVLREIPYSGIRRAIGEHMSLSRSTSPTVTHHTRADVDELVHLVHDRNEGRPESERISLTAAVIKASAAAIAAEPSINATLVDEVIRVWRSIDVGVAVAVEGGLIVPVIRGADAKSLDDVSLELAELSARAREGTLLFEEVSGSTFTITNVGGFRSVDWFTPIINQPEAAILGVGRIVEELVVRHGAPVVRQTLGLSLTFDHRIIDGAPAAAFLRILLDHLEEPERLLG
jgi:pyruvate dehydrogenase E2 component (dihydrolipoamide acetyltransferase)